MDKANIPSFTTCIVGGRQRECYPQGRGIGIPPPPSPPSFGRIQRATAKDGTVRYDGSWTDSDRK